MQSTQSKFFALLSARVAPLGYQIVRNSEWSNTGNFQIENPDSMKPALSIRYNFQSQYATFTVEGALGSEHPYVKNAELDAFIDRIVGNLPRVKNEIARKVGKKPSTPQIHAALAELIEQASREDDGNFFSGVGVGVFGGVVRLTMQNGDTFAVAARAVPSANIGGSR